MEIVEHKRSVPDREYKTVHEYDVKGIRLQEKERCLISEYILLIFIGSRPAFKVVCTPSHIPELVVGRLVTELGIFPENIEKIDICHSGNAAKVFLKSSADFKGLKADAPEISTCCTDNRTLLNTDTDLLPLPDIDPDLTLIEKIRQKAGEDNDLHKETGSAHSSILMYDGEVIFEAGDIGRHNAIDKAVGFIYINDLDPAKAILYTTGRMPVDMVRKVIRAGIPVLVSRQYPTVEAVEMSEKYDLKLIGHLREDHMEYYGRKLPMQDH